MNNRNEFFFHKKEECCLYACFGMSVCCVVFSFNVRYPNAFDIANDLLCFSLQCMRRAYCCVSTISNHPNARNDVLKIIRNLLVCVRACVVC